jgi:flagellar biosynthesis/type III secretory pathway M-ring protein FliF/YscJ
MSLAILVDQDVTWQKEQNGYQRVLVPPTPEKLKVIRDLIAGITGFSEERGDQFTIETLPFETTLLLEPPGAAKPQANAPAAPGIALPMNLKLDQKTLMIAGGGLAAVVILLILFLIFRRKRRVTPAVESQPALAPGASGPPALPSVASGNVEKEIESQLAERDALQQRMDAQALNSLKLAPVITKKAEVFAKHLREKITKEPDISVQILKSWIRAEEE